MSWWGNDAKLLHHAQGIEVGPVFRDLAALDATYDYACYLYLVASGRNTRQLTSVSAAKRKAGSYLVPLRLPGPLRWPVDRGRHCGNRGVLLGGLNAAYIFRISGVVSNVVSGVYLVCCVQVTLDEGLINTSINVRKLHSCQGVALLPLFTEMPRDCMKSLADDGGVVPRRAETRLFRPIATPYAGQIRAPDVAPTTFHTVSEEKFSELRLHGVLRHGVHRSSRSGWGMPRLHFRHKSLFGKVHTSLASRLSIRRIIATSMNVSLVCTFRS